MRFVIINSNTSFNKLFIKEFLDKNDFNEINGLTGGDNDFICVDTVYREWCWCENGFVPFCSNSSMMIYQFDNYIRLQELIDNRS